MDSFDDETLQSFVEESRAHLAHIEKHLLALENGGAEIDEALINKVFRAAQSIKGGAGFMGLETIKNLAHKTENVLGMMRSQEFAPNAEGIHILRMSFDRLREMINNVNASNNEDITEYTAALAGLTAAHLPAEDKHAVTENVEISLPSGQTVFTVSRFDIHRAQTQNQTVLLIEFDLIHDIHGRGLTPLTFLRELAEQVDLIDCTVEIDDAGSLDDEGIIGRLPLYILMSSEVVPGNAAPIFGVTPERVHFLAENLMLKTVDVAGFEIITPPASLTEPLPPVPCSSHADAEPEPVAAQDPPAESLLHFGDSQRERLAGTSSPTCAGEADTGASGRARGKILYAEDSDIFRARVRALLEEEGYEVIAAENGLEAWDMLQAHTGDISMVLTDIEMPHLDGLGLAQRMRGDERFQDIPIIALTAIASDRDVARGKAIGVADYQVKLDKDRLLSSIRAVMNR